jgi:hypothetical protein
MAWPLSRAMATMPLAPPLRSRGAADISAFRLGDWNRPNPAPHTTMRSTMAPTDASTGNVASAAIPPLSNTRPMPPSKPGG